MKILIVLPNNSLGGAEQYLKMVAEYYIKLNTEVTIVFLGDKIKNSWFNLKKKKNVEYKLYKHRYKFINLINFIFYLFFLRNKNFKYIYTSHIKTNGLLGVLLNFKLLRKGFFIARESTNTFSRFRGLKLRTYKVFYNIGYSQVDLLICQTHTMKDELIDVYSRLEQKSIVLQNPIDLNLIALSQIEGIKELEKPFFDSFIVSAGRLIPEKGFDILIRAFARLKQEDDKYIDLKLVILGEGSERIKLEELIRELNLEKEVLLRGLVLNVYPYFKKADVCVVSSRIEGFPNVLLQMMSQNEKIVSTNCSSGVEEIPNILICETNNVERLNQQIQQVIKTNTKVNKLIYKEYLEKRDIGFFIKQLEHELIKRRKII